MDGLTGLDRFGQVWTGLDGFGRVWTELTGLPRGRGGKLGRRVYMGVGGRVGYVDW